MNLFQNIISKLTPRAEQTKADNSDIDFGGAWREVTMGGVTMGIQGSGLGQYKGWVFRAVKLIAQEVSTIQLTLMKGDKEVTNKPEIMHPLENPNSMQTFTKLISATQSYLELTGRCFWYLPKGATRKKPMEIWILRPDLVKVVKGKKMEAPIKGYVMTINGEQIPFEPEEIIPFFEFSPNSPLTGVGALQASGEAVDTDNEVKKWNNKFFKNSARPDVVLEYDGTMDDKKYKQIQTKWEDKHQGSENAHKMAILSGGLKMQKWNFNQKEMDFVEQRKFGRDEILTVFGVPKGLLIADDVNLANSRSALWHFLRFTIKPKMHDLVDQLNQYYLDRYWPGEGYYFTYVDPVPADREAKLAEYEKAYNKWLTVNEIRELEGYEPVENGDVLYIPTGLVEIGEQIDYGGMFGGGNEPDPDDEPEPKKQFKKDKINNKLDDGYADILEEEDFEERGEKQHKEMIKRTETVEQYIAQEVKNEFERQAQEAIMNLKTKKSYKGKINATDLIDKRGAIDAVVGFLTEAELKNILDNGQAGLAMVGIESIFDLETERVQAFIRDNIGRASKAVVNETFRKLRKTLAQAEADGADIETTSQNIQKLFKDMEFYRAERIARKETMTSANFGMVESWKQSGIVTGQKWYTADDERVCPMCWELHGKMVGLGGTFLRKGETQIGSDGNPYPVDYENVKYGSRHPNCRCVLLPVTADSKTYEDLIRKQETDKQIKAEVHKAKKEIEKEVVEKVGEIINEE
jgi:HK97 family phage portal protein